MHCTFTTHLHYTHTTDTPLPPSDGWAYARRHDAGFTTGAGLNAGSAKGEAGAWKYARRHDPAPTTRSQSGSPVIGGGPTPREVVSGVHAAGAHAAGHAAGATGKAGAWVGAPGSGLKARRSP